MLALLFGWLWLAPPAPQNTEFGVQERLRVEYVLLDVVALTRKGEIVDDLTASDFEVKENKNKVEVTYFDTLDFRAGAEPDLSDIPEEFRSMVSDSSKQQIILAIDLESTQMTDAKKTFAQLQDFLKSLDGNTSYHINIYSMERGSITKGFVNNVQAALEALAELEGRHFDGLMRQNSHYSSGGEGLLLGDGRRNRPRRTNDQGMLREDSHKLAHLEEALRTCATLHNFDLAMRNKCINDSVGDFILEQQYRTERIIGELEILTYKFEANQGLKTMLFVSPGFALNSMSSAMDLARAYKRGDDPVGPGEGFIDIGSFRIQREDFQRVIHACIKNRVIFHTFDIFNSDEALRRSTSAAFSNASAAVTRAYRNYSFEVADGLRELADESGGDFFQGGALTKAMNRTLDKNQFFYVIGYNSPKDGKPGKFRKIKIKVKRKKVKLRYRQGYFGS